MGNIYKNVDEVFKNHEKGYQTQIPQLLDEIKKYYREYITMDSRVRLLEEDIEVLRDEIKDIQQELKIRKIERAIPIHKSLIDFWNNEYDKRWDDY